MDKVTPEQIRRAIQIHRVQSWVYRRCQSCDAALSIDFLADSVETETACDCPSEIGSPPQRGGYEDIAAMLNEQTPLMRGLMWRAMLNLDAPKDNAAVDAPMETPNGKAWE